VLLSVTAINSQLVIVTWRAPTQPNGALISYAITYNLDGGTSSNINVPYNGRDVSHLSIQHRGYIHISYIDTIL